MADLNQSVPDGIDVANADLAFKKTGGGEILSKSAERQLGKLERLAPGRVMFAGINTDGPVHASMNASVGLTIAVQAFVPDPTGSEIGVLMKAVVHSLSHHSAEPDGWMV